MPDLERRVPDEQCRVVLCERLFWPRRDHLVPRQSAVDTLQHDLGQDLARRRLARERHLTRLRKRLSLARSQQHAHHLTVRGYAVTRYSPETVAVARPARRR